MPTLKTSNTLPKELHNTDEMMAIFELLTNSHVADLEERGRLKLSHS